MCRRVWCDGSQAAQSDITVDGRWMNQIVRYWSVLLHAVLFSYLSGNERQQIFIQLFQNVFFFSRILFMATGRLSTDILMSWLMLTQSDCLCIVRCVYVCAVMIGQTLLGVVSCRYLSQLTNAAGFVVSVLQDNIDLMYTAHILVLIFSTISFGHWICYIHIWSFSSAVIWPNKKTFRKSMISMQKQIFRENDNDSSTI